MALEYAHGVIGVASTDGVGTTFTVSGLSFQPKAMRFVAYVDPRTNNPVADFAAEDIHGRISIGFATSTTDRRALGVLENDSSGSMGCSSRWSESLVVVGNALTSVALDLDLDAINSDGFRLIVVTQNGGGTATIFWEAWGGSDITVAKTVAIAEPAATGDQDYAVTGFVAGATDQVVMFAGIQTTGAAEAGPTRTDSGLCLGFATGGLDANNVVTVGNNDDGSASADTDGYCKTGECLAMITLAGGNPNARAKLTQFNTDGFRLNWIARATTDRRYIALAIKGGQWRAGSYTIVPETAGNTATVSGLPFTPIGISLIGRGYVENSAGVSGTQNRVGIGRGTSTTSRSSFGVLSEDGTATQEVNVAVEHDQVLVYPSTAGAVRTAYDIDAMLSDGFRIIVDVADAGLGPIDEWQGYLTFASASAGSETPKAVDDTLSLTEAQARQAQKTLAETVSLAEAVSARTGKALADALALSEGLTKETRRAILETVAATEALVLQAAKAQAENLGLSENLASSKVVLESVADTVTLTESLARLIGKTQAETLAPSEALTRLTARLQEETVTLTEAQAREARKTLAELLGFTEALITGVFLRHSVADTLGLTEDLQAETLAAHQEAETLVLTEAQQRVIGRALQETLGLTETRMVAIAKSVGDLVSLEETLARLMARRFEEAPAFAEALTANIGGRLPDFDRTEARPAIRTRSFSAAIGHRGMVPLGASTRAVEDA